MKKALLVIGISLCLMIAGNKIYNFYLSSQPPYAVGECFSIFDPRIGDIKFEVVDNDSANKVTQAVATVEIMPGAQIQIPVQATFDEIRGSNPKKVSCQ